jgi:hypothetical protein
VAFDILADAVMVTHFAFLAFIAVGGFLAWRWRWVFVPHVGAAAWGLYSAAIGAECPLTGWENSLRRLGGESGLPSGFIDTYLTGVVYPEEHLRTLQAIVAGLVVVSWLGLVLRHKAGRLRRGRLVR